MTVLGRALAKAYRHRGEQAGPQESAAQHAAAPSQVIAHAVPQPANRPIARTAADTLPWRWPPLCAQLLDQAEQGFSQLADVLLEAAASQHLKNIALSSPRRGGGTTSVALTVARVFANRGTARILLVDADFESPALAQRLGLTPEAGLWEVLAGTVSLQQVLERMTEGVVSLLPLVRRIMSSELAQGQPRVRSILRQVRGEFDLVLIDAGPQSAEHALDNSWLRGSVDGVVTVSHSRQIAESELQTELQSWRRTGIESLGVIETFA